MSKRLRIGIANPDTTHARAFAEYLRGRSDVDLTSIISMSGVRSPAHIEAFAEEFELDVAATPSEFLDEINAALLLSVDWQLHLPLTEYLMGEGKAVLIDKPLAGSIPDLRMLEAFEREHPGKLFGGSALPYVTEVVDFRARVDRNGLQRLTIKGPRDGFFMGVHSSELVASFIELDENATCEFDQASGTTIFQTALGFESRLVDADEGWEIFAETSAGDETLQVPLARIYDNYLLAFLWMVQSGEPVENVAAKDGVLLELAAAKSKKLGRRVSLSELDDTDKISSSQFVQSYKQRFFDVPL